MARLSLSLIVFGVFLNSSPVHPLVPPKTPVITGFEPAAIGSNRELVCDAYQPDAGTITYEWYKYSAPDSQGNTWISRGPIGTGQKYIFSPVPEKQLFHQGNDAVHVSGKYRCRASNSVGTRDSDWGDLYVYKPCALYTVSVTPAKPAIGSTFTLKCHIPYPSGHVVFLTKHTDSSSTVVDEAVASSKGCHTPTRARFSWSSCSPPSVSSKTKTFNLQVINAQTSDYAYWICKDLGLGCNSNPVRPVVQAQPGTPQITGFPSGPVAAGTQVNLRCVASPPGDTYDWFKDDIKLSTSLTYDFIVKKESTGVYKCVARNTAGSATSSNKTLIVYSKSDSVVVSSGKTSCHAGETDMFTCTATGGFPPPTLAIYIKRSGETPVNITQAQDRVMAKEDNQAEYYCEANVAGYPTLSMASTMKTYTVTFPNTIVSFINNPTAAVQVGQVKKFTCETDESNPVASIKWYQYVEGGSWQDVTSGITQSERNDVSGGKIRISELSVTATKAMNGGTVRCTSSYSLAGHSFTTSADTVMNVKWSGTELKMVEKPNSPITTGTSVNIKCETDSSNSGPPGTISWYRNGQQITKGVTQSTRTSTYGGTIYISQLSVTARKEDNQAKYECKINDQANFKKDVTITVYYPADIKLSLSPSSVKEGDTPAVACEASGGNPSTYTYHWLYKQKQVQGETSKVYRIKNIQANQSGSYCCQAVNAGGKSEGCKHINVLFKAKWNPDLPSVFNVATKPYRPVKFTLHVIANPPITGITWVHPNTKPAKNENFFPTKVNETTYALSKSAIGFQDYGNYTARVSNSVGTSSFVFELQQAGPPLTPCCLMIVNSSSVYVTLTFKSNFNGGLVQTFTIEYRTPGAAWRVGVKDIADPGLGQNVIQRVSGLESDEAYEIQVKSVNDVGASGYEDVIRLETKASPNITLMIDRRGREVVATWTPIKRPFTMVQIKYCAKESPSTACSNHTLADPTESHATFDVKEETKYVFYLEVFDGADRVFRSTPVVPQLSGTNGWMVVALLSLITLLAAGIAQGVVMYRRSMACFADRKKAEPSTNEEGAVEIGTVSVIHDPDYMDVGVQNRAFDDDYERPTVDAESNPGGDAVPGVTENQYATLDMLDTTPDVTAPQGTYEELKPYKKDES